ncbi:MAG: Ku protein [Alphaproteobacteria bacterium]|nr:Ku protein [Alphaproteobacteria bacterium]
MPEPTWNGFLRLSLVSCPVYLSPATTDGRRVKLERLSARTGNPVRQQFVDPRTGDVVAPEALVHGYEFSHGRYVNISDAELRELETEPSKIIDIDYFVPQQQIDRLYLETPFYLYPDGQLASDTVHALRLAMERNERAAIGRVQLEQRERLVLIEPLGGGLMLSTLRSADDVQPAEFTERSEHEIPAEMIEIAESIINRRAGAFEKNALRDRHEDALRRLVDEKVRRAPAGGASAQGGPDFHADRTVTQAADSGAAPPRPQAGSEARPQTTQQTTPQPDGPVRREEAAEYERAPASGTTPAAAPEPDAIPQTPELPADLAGGVDAEARIEAAAPAAEAAMEEEAEAAGAPEPAAAAGATATAEAGAASSAIAAAGAGTAAASGAATSAAASGETAPAAAQEPESAESEPGVRDIGAEILLHIVGLGDRRYIEPGWAGNPGSRRQIEALSIRPREGLASSAVEFKVFAQEGRATSWVSDGNYAGTRGRGLPLTGFAVRPAEDLRDRLEISYEGCFFEGGVVGPKRDGELCMSPVANDPLEAVRVSIVERAAE